MVRVTATAFIRNFARYQDEAHRHVVAVTSHEREIGYFLSPKDYAEYEELRAKARRNLRVGELPDSVLRAIRETTMDQKHQALDELMRD
jgi:hypothetical protein